MTNTTEPVHVNPPYPPILSGTTVAGIMSDADNLTLALNKILMEYPAIVRYRTNLTYFCFLVDQVRAEVPRIHPMEVAQQLMLRLFPEGDRQLIADAFQLGTVVANNLREWTAAHNERAKAELSEASARIMGWQKPGSVYDPTAKK